MIIYGSLIIGKYWLLMVDYFNEIFVGDSF